MLKAGCDAFYVKPLDPRLGKVPNISAAAILDECRSAGEGAVDAVIAQARLPAQHEHIAGCELEGLGGR